MVALLGFGVLPFPPDVREPYKVEESASLEVVRAAEGKLLNGGQQTQTTH
uniref:Uncharacterized protein n=1 Tax=Arundo donax TaxID=35708 RepID=A0A0A9C0B4_ARUDO